MCVCVCVCVGVCVCMCVCVYIYIYTNIWCDRGKGPGLYVYIHVYIHTYIYMCVCVCVCVCVRACNHKSHQTQRICKKNMSHLMGFMIGTYYYQILLTNPMSRIRVPMSSRMKIGWHRMSRGGGLGSRPKKMYGERLGDGVEYHLMSPTPRR